VRFIISAVTYTDNHFTDLETNGMTLPGETETIRCGLYLYIGDNLEVHTIGGFSGSFNHGHVCRYCSFEHKGWNSNNFENTLI
jgi:hypothetical protein